MTLLEMQYDRNVWKKINVENKNVWHEMAEEWLQNKWQRTGIFKSEESLSENFNLFIFVSEPAPLRPKSVKALSFNTRLVINQQLMGLYLKVKSQSINAKYANESVGTRVRLMVRGSCLQVKEWKCIDHLCECGTKEMGVLSRAMIRWSCHSGHKLLCKLCRTFPPPAMGARFTFFWTCRPC